jgi:hypothetical protein
MSLLGCGFGFRVESAYVQESTVKVKVTGCQAQSRRRRYVITGAGM